jgi:acyl carrier protein
LATIEERVQAVVSDKLGVDIPDVVPGASFVDDLNADSLDLVELIMAFEEEFSSDDSTIEIGDDEAESITNVQQAIDFLRSKGITDG